LKYVFPAILALAPHVALADPTLECSGGSQVEISACVSEMKTRVDGAVQTALDIARAGAQSLDDATGRKQAGPALEAAQEAWSSYRDAQCALVGASFGGGSGTSIAITSCHVELGRLRVTELLRAFN
jgi:uncharacterized protein YecT (DUF1311 family)